MKRLMQFVCLSVIGLATLSAHADSFDGTDWLIDISGSLVVTGTISSTVPINTVGASLSVNQSTPTSFSIPLNFPPFLSVTVPMNQTGSGLGSIVSGTFSTAGPIVIPSGTISGINFDIRLRNIIVNLHGVVTGFTTSAPGYPDSFGHRVYEITGTPTTDPFSTNPNTTWGQVRDIEAFFGFWVRIGQANLDIDAWRAYRPVPEPASMVALGTGLVSLIALRRRRK